MTAVTHAIPTEVREVPSVPGCGDVGERARLRYFHGRALSALDLRREQAYHVEKARLHNRLLHGWGIVCGLDIEIAPEKDCDPTDDDRDATTLIVSPGAALDCHGNDVIVRTERRLVLERLLSEDDRRSLGEKPQTVWLTLCYRERPIDPTRPLLASGCDPVPDCEYGRVCETYAICASTTRPDPGPACEPCCGGCGEPCIELAAILDYTPGKPAAAEQVDLRGRRGLALHPFATIAALNWVHGATYTREDATTLLATGIEVRFSRPVQSASVRDGVVELTTIEAGGGRSAGVYNVEGQLDVAPKALTDRLVFRSTGAETLQYGDRVVIRIRGDLILDECCRAVDANNIGGTVPLLDERPSEPAYAPDGPACPPRPSGNGTEGGEFVSWIFVQDRSSAR